MYISNVNSSSIKLQSIEYQNVPVSESVEIFSEEDLVMVYINKGAAHYQIEDETSEFKKRELLILNPQTKVLITPIRKLEWIVINVSGILFTSSLEINSIQRHFITEDPHQIIKSYLDLAIIEEANPFRGTDIIMKKLLECVMVHVLRDNGLSIKDASVQVKHDEIDRVQEYIREHYSKKITLDELSEYVDINKYYLIRLFKQKTGLSPIDYLIHVRLAEAEKLLSRTDITISKISDMVGFHSPSHFSKTFKESNHCTPSAYRKKNQQIVK